MLPLLCFEKLKSEDCQTARVSTLNHIPKSKTNNRRQSDSLARHKKVQSSATNFSWYSTLVFMLMIFNLERSDDIEHSNIVHSEAGNAQIVLSNGINSFGGGQRRLSRLKIGCLFFSFRFFETLTASLTSLFLCRPGQVAFVVAFMLLLKLKFIGLIVIAVRLDVEAFFNTFFEHFQFPWKFN